MFFFLLATPATTLFKTFLEQPPYSCKEIIKKSLSQKNLSFEDIQTFIIQHFKDSLTDFSLFNKSIIRSKLHSFPSHVFFHYRSFDYFSNLFLTYLNLDLEISQKYLETYNLLNSLKSFQLILSEDDTTIIVDLIFNIEK